MRDHYGSQFRAHHDIARLTRPGMVFTIQCSSISYQILGLVLELQAFIRTTNRDFPYLKKVYELKRVSGVAAWTLDEEKRG